MVHEQSRPLNRARLIEGKYLYIGSISVLGLVLVGWGLGQLPGYEQLPIFFMLLALAVVAQITSTSLLDASVTVEVSTAVSLATVALYGPVAASVVAAGALVSLSFLSLRRKWQGWPQALTRASFNMGMAATAIFMAGLVFQISSAWLGSETLLGQTVPWLLAAIVNDQLNMWLLIGVLHSESGVRRRDIWNEHKWAIPINVLVMSIGGGVLTVAIEQLNLLGLAIFFLPIAMSAYSFRLYVNQTKLQMERLEDEVALRTRDLAEANQQLSQ